MTDTRSSAGSAEVMRAQCLKAICSAGDRCSCADRNWQWRDHDCEVAMSHVDAIVAALHTGDVAQGAQDPVAFVPVHPRNGPLWSDTYAAASFSERSPNYPRMALYAGPVSPSSAGTGVAVLPIPVVEIDETAPILDLVWRSGDASFSIVISQSKLVGIHCTMEPPRSNVAWTVPLPAGLISIRPEAFTGEPQEALKPRPDIVGVLRSVHSALDSALGDSDVTHIENDDELREEHPVQWAAQWLAHAIDLLEEGSAHSRPQSRTGEA